ncbi:DUF445 domain-containing protein [Niabella terrae]
MQTLFILIPLISAFIGWLAGYFFGHYMIPRYLKRRQEPLIEKLALSIASRLPVEELSAAVADPALIEKAMPSIEAHIDEFLNVKLAQEIPMLAMFVGNKTTDKVKEVFINQLKTLFPQVMTDMLGGLRHSDKLSAAIKTKLAEVDLPTVVRRQLAPVLRRHQLFFALTGLIIGGVSLLLFGLLSA